MTTEVQALGVPRDDLAAAGLGIEPVPARHRVLGFLDYFVLWADLGVGLLVLLAGTLLVPGLGFWPAMAAIVGGTLMNESISRAAGAAHGQELVPEAMEALIRSIGRRPRQRTTLYGRPPEEQVRRSFGAPPLSELIQPTDLRFLRAAKTTSGGLNR